MPLTPASSVFAMSLTGDIGDVTFVQKAGQRRTSYAKTWPNKIPTPAQKRRRDLMRQAVRAWQAETAEHKRICNLIARKFNMPMSGYNLFIGCFTNDRIIWLEQWAQQFGEVW